MRTISISLGLAEITRLKHRWWQVGSYFLLVACILTFCDHSEGSDRDLVSLRVQAHFHAVSLRSLQFSFHHESNTGRSGNADFVGRGDRFRLDRQDATASRTDKEGPFSVSTAYNGQRQQRLDHNQSFLRLEDGNDGARYSVNTPQTLAYLWLKKPGGPALRWDMIVDSALWEKRFADAAYVGKVDQDGRVLEVVEFPQREGVRTPCIFKVFFAPDLGYLPVKFVRRVEKSGEISTTMEVTRFKTFEIDGQQVAAPVEVVLEERGADKVSMIQKMRVVVDEGSLRVNEDVDDSLFTLDTSGVKEIYDIDEYNRIVAEIEGADRRGGVETRSVSASRRLLLSLTSVMVVVAIVAIFAVRRRRSGK